MRAPPELLLYQFVDAARVSGYFPKYTAFTR